MVFLKNFSVKNQEICFDIKGLDLVYINALRRTVISEIETCAIHFVKINKNSSNVPEEYLAHRFGMLPIRCQESKNTEELPLFLQLKNDTNDVISVSSKDIVDPNHAYEICQKIMLLHLHPEQEIDVEFFVRRGTAKVHAKWCPVSAPAIVDLPESSAYRFQVEVTENYNVQKLLPDGMKYLRHQLSQFQKENNKYFL